MEGVFDGGDLGDVALVGAHPAADAGVEVVEVLDDEGAAGVFAVGAGEVEGEDEGVAEVGRGGSRASERWRAAGGCDG